MNTNRRAYGAQILCSHNAVAVPADSGEAQDGQREVFYSQIAARR